MRQKPRVVSRAALDFPRSRKFFCMLACAYLDRVDHCRLGTELAALSVLPDEPLSSMNGIYIPMPVSHPFRATAYPIHTTQSRLNPGMWTHLLACKVGSVRLPD